MLHIGITGSRHGPTKEAASSLSKKLLELRWPHRSQVALPITMHHGACVGVDSMVARLSRWMGFVVEAHPPSVDTLVCKHSLNASHKINDARPYLTRNRAIVKASSHLFALPNSMEEEQRSGTWATVRYARAHGIEITIIYPDGTIDHEPPTV